MLKHGTFYNSVKSENYTYRYVSISFCMGFFINVQLLCIDVLYIEHVFIAGPKEQRDNWTLNQESECT